MKTLTQTLIAIGFVLSISLTSARAQIIITEVDPEGSSTSTPDTVYHADWFELTNEGSSSVDISGWTMDDSHASVTASVALNGVTDIAAGQSVVFVESDGSSSTVAAFEQAWFGNNVPVGFTIGTYGTSKSSVGLSQGGDAVNIYNASGVLQSSISFVAASTDGATLDNSALVNGGPISTFSQVGVDGAFESASGVEVGSPGVAEAPEPSSFALILGSFGLLAFGLRRRIAGLL